MKLTVFGFLNGEDWCSHGVSSPAIFESSDLSRFEAENMEFGTDRPFSSSSGLLGLVEEGRKEAMISDVAGLGHSSSILVFISCSSAEVGSIGVDA